MCRSPISWPVGSSPGGEPDQDAFSETAKAFPNEDGVVKAYELAPNGVVTDIYPMQGNEKALSLNLLTQNERYYDALRAKETGKYTLGCPYTLKQGGQGALLFTPVYIPAGRGTIHFGDSSSLSLTGKNS